MYITLIACEMFPSQGRPRSAVLGAILTETVTNHAESAVVPGKTGLSCGAGCNADSRPNRARRRELNDRGAPPIIREKAPNRRIHVETLIVFAVVLAVGLMIVGVIRTAKRQLQAFDLTMRQHGFLPVERLDDNVREKFAGLLRRRTEHVHFSRIYRHDRMDYDLYRLNVTRGDGDAEPMFALIGRPLDLPRFMVVPRVTLPGVLNSLWKKLFERLVAGFDLTEMTLADCVRFGEKYQLFAADPDGIRHSVPAAAWERLTAQTQIMLSAVDDMIIFQEMPFPKVSRRKGGKSLEEELPAAAGLADQLYRSFRAGRPAAAKT